MDRHYNIEGASELYINEMVLITMAYRNKTVENTLRVFIAECHDHDTNQLTNFENVRDKSSKNEGGY
jgi:hypothetical protein